MADQKVKETPELANAKIGIIGGSGLYSMPGFEAHQELTIDTPWGNRQTRTWSAGWQARRWPSSRATGAGTDHAFGTELPRQHLGI